MADGSPKVLVIGYGNPGRQDDGLGPALARFVEGLSLAGVTVDADYQLNVEDAAAVAEHDVVILADAAVAGPEPYAFIRIEPKPALSFTSHSLEPEALLAMARDLFGAQTRGYMLGIRGYNFNEFGETISGRARENLTSATDFIQAVLADRDFDRYAAEPEEMATLKAASSNGD